MAKEGIKLETLAIVVIAAILVMQAFKEPAAPVIGTTTTTTAGVDLCGVVEPEISLTGQRMFLQGTALTGEYARIIRVNGNAVEKDLGQTSMNSGTQSTSPKKAYKIYWGENSTSYYTHVESYTAPCEDATDNKVGTLCTFDSTPTVTVFDEFGNVQSAGTNVQAVGSSETVDVEIEVKVSADQCYGNPDAPGTNALCFLYNTSALKSVEVIDGNSIGAPYSISNNKSSGDDVSCYALDKLQDTARVRIPVRVTAKSGVNPGNGGNVTVIPNDIAFDLNQDTLVEIWGFEDESNNELGATTSVTSYIYIS